MVVLVYPVPHSKFQGHRSTGSGEEIFLGFFFRLAFGSGELKTTAYCVKNS